ncbi:head GIN domain-containing protein [Hymenobacter guriensis]|uniref:DUF2807 domain-containing protein n=1 Tax=Hymenobacter guriensis TaxID=2793065 RepID=A0ABS0KZN0_9BACT|nr:head GIN domain-containing protein [Hymenobacter guriensis]MBG8553331.1 DUF2807 domain-containing protein [Hymenobacter guriensis]
MKTFLLSALLPLTVLLASCHNDLMGPTVRGSGPMTSENRSIRDFTELELPIDAEVYLTQGLTQEVRVEAQRNILDVLETDVEGNRLHIDFGRTTVRKHDRIRVYLTTPTLSRVILAGSGRIESTNTWLLPRLEVSISGSGSTDLACEQATAVATTISGSGRANWRGNAARHEISISGSGQVNSYDLDTDAVDVDLVGSGRARVSATEKLDVRISGSGNVYYKGEPSINTQISGSGRVLSDN